MPLSLLLKLKALSVLLLSLNAGGAGGMSKLMLIDSPPNAGGKLAALPNARGKLAALLVLERERARAALDIRAVETTTIPAALCLIHRLVPKLSSALANSAGFSHGS